MEDSQPESIESGYREAQGDGTLWLSLNLVPGRESIVPEITKLEGNWGDMDIVFLARSPQHHRPRLRLR
jgi:hypothetical protein